jgi:glycosyltransferase involved in cell wall biosynthesis
MRPTRLERCIEKALRALRENNISGEVIIADNGSTDDSSAITTHLGARVVAVVEKGYGSP